MRNHFWVAVRRTVFSAFGFFKSTIASLATPPSPLPCPLLPLVVGSCLCHPLVLFVHWLFSSVGGFRPLVAFVARWWFSWSLGGVRAANTTKGMLSWSVGGFRGFLLCLCSSKRCVPFYSPHAPWGCFLLFPAPHIAPWNGLLGTLRKKTA